jgi:outer membrane protein OmpA-like peptidoglycan-associated protein
MSARRWMTALGLLAAACGSAPERPAGPPPEAVAEEQAEPLLGALDRDLQAVPVEPLGLGGLEADSWEGQLLLNLPAEAFFEQGNAQLKVTALKPLAEIAAAVIARGASVVHVVGLAPEERKLDLAERRAASVAAYLMNNGIEPARLRHESRAGSYYGDTVTVVLKPVVLGREKDAWTPPELEE